MSDPTTETSETPVTPGRRRAAAAPGGRRRFDPVLLAAVVVPVLALLVGLGVRVDAPGAAEPTAPDVEPRTSATVVCPSTGVASGSAEDPSAVVPEAGRLSVATSPEVTGGEVDLAGETVAVDDGAVVTSESGEPTTATATGEAARGLHAARYDASGATGWTCREPDTGGWFVGLGGGAERASVVELTNPDSGTAAAALTLYGESGPVDAEAIRSVVVGPGETRRFDLAAIAPVRGELALHVDVTRGRLGMGVLQALDPLAGGAVTTTWAAIQEAPARELTLLGSPGDTTAARTLVVTNPGENQARVTVEVVGVTGIFEPAGVEALEVAPGGVASLDLTEALAAVDDGVLGVRVTGTEPVAAALRTGTGAGEASAVVAEPLTSGGALLPAGATAARLVLTGDGDETEVEVVARDAAGAELARRAVTLADAVSGVVDLAPGTARVEVVGATDAGGVRGAVVVTAGGRPSVVALSPVVVDERVPAARPAWP
ncbi:DUF5719 family protein [Nocardioides alkalitolerans]|uniref:DUF5719 family protein n=1 Tax=Nocardioides alkalitolerans TaxID=281714 RepID=UPI0004029521|nr:DUF5719 family protein [Nocardioides alkalitolerans]